MPHPASTNRPQQEQEQEQNRSALNAAPMPQMPLIFTPPPPIAQAAAMPLAPTGTILPPHPLPPISSTMVARGSKRPPENAGNPIHQQIAPYPMYAPLARTPYAALPTMNLPVANKGTTLTDTRSPQFMEAGKGKVTSSKNRRRKGNLKSRRMSSDVAKSTTPKTSMIIVSDEAPDRITNPLIEPLPPRNTVEFVHGAELYCAMDLVFHRPDTYPLSYLARILGFDVPVASENREFPTPLPDVETLPLLAARKDDPFFEIPNEESKIHFKQVNAKGQDKDDHLTLDYMDPIYSKLLQKGYSFNMLQPCTTTLVTKFAAKQKEQGATRHNVVKMAQSMLPNWDGDWTFSDWIAAKTDDKDASTTHWTIDGKIVFSNPPAHAFGIIASYKGKPRAILKYQFKWYQISNDMRESELVMALQGIGQPTTEPVTVREYASSSPAKAYIQGVAASTSPNTDFNTMATLTTDAAASESLEETGPKSIENESLATKDGSTLQQPMEQTQNMKPQPSTTCDEAKEPAVAQEPKVDVEPKAKLIDLLPVSSLAGDSVVLVMFAMALEHTRACGVWYSLWDKPRNDMEFNKDCFRMSKMPSQGEGDRDPMVCDLKKCSTKYAFLKMNEKSVGSGEASLPKSRDGYKERWLIRLPNVDEAKACFDAEAMLAVRRATRGIVVKPPSRMFTGATGKAQEVTVGIRAVLDAGAYNEEAVKLLELHNSAPGKELQIPQRTEMESNVEILKCFPLKGAKNTDDSKESEILVDLKNKQEELAAAEKALEPRLRQLMSKVINERLEYEKPESRQKRADAERLLDEHRKAVERRKDMDQKLQEQLEQDMNAVCSICGDGEVTPDNQILFCEACDVPVHQICYGIKDVPKGDYYCVACRYFKRDKMNVNKNPSATRVPSPVLPIRCELCPVKQGAYIRTESPKNAPEKIPTKWVHMACAKWQGLNFVEKSNPECVEDVSSLKIYFRRLDYACDICQGKRGAYHECYYEGCNKWMHMSCAMACGMCEVNYGEDVEGEATEKPWTLMCSEHSAVDKKESETKPVSIEELICAAKEFPEEPMPEAPPPRNRVFNKLSGAERARALANPEYEQAILEELLTKKFAGVRCECCDIEDNGIGLQRCSSCWNTVCTSCRLTEDDNSAEQKYFTCFSCQYIQENTKEGKEFEHPRCGLCSQNGGLLLNGIAKPVGRLSYWKQNPKLFEKSIFGKKLWTHYTCAFWSKGVKINSSNCSVDFSDVVMSNGKGYVQGKIPCYLCGLKAGMKTKCYDPECRARGERNRPYHFHVSCARQAGYEVNHNDENPADGQFYVCCYEHGGNEYNLRARLEDVIEVERKRSGKKFGKADAPMNFNDASRLLSCSMLVVRILGWAWRWAELWVENDSTWEPLLEAGQKEENMTKAQLKIVESTPESRCEDARRCRLAAFGAALRNRGYDQEEKFDDESLNGALRAVLHTKSLVGPWRDFEIDFFVDWLGRAYRSKSQLLSLGDDKARIGNEDFCFHIDDKSPKYELGNRPLPGKTRLAKDLVFEKAVQEPDDFLKPEMIDGVPMERKKKPRPKKRWMDDEDERKKSQTPERVEAPKPRGPGSSRSMDRQTEAPAKKRGPGRPKSVDRVNSPSEYMSPFDKSAGLAALVPSAIKKRRAPPPDRTAPKSNAASRSPKKEGGFPVLEAEVPYDNLTPDGPLRQARRGRPPRVLNLSLVVRIGNKDFNPFSQSRADDTRDSVDNETVKSSRAGSSSKVDVESSRPSRRSLKQPEAKEKSSAETSKISENESEVEEKVAPKRRGRPPKRKAEAPPPESEEEKQEERAVSKRGGHPPKKRRRVDNLGAARRRKRTRASLETAEPSDVSESEEDEQAEEQTGVHKRRGRPSKRTAPETGKRRSRTPVTYAEKNNSDESESEEEPEEPVVVKRRGLSPTKKARTNKTAMSKQIDSGTSFTRQRSKTPPKMATIAGSRSGVSRTQSSKESVSDDESDGYGTDASIPLSTLYPPSKATNEENSDKQVTSNTGEEEEGTAGPKQMPSDKAFSLTKPARLAGKKEAAKFVFLNQY